MDLRRLVDGEVSDMELRSVLVSRVTKLVPRRLVQKRPVAPRPPAPVISLFKELINYVELIS